MPSERAFSMYGSFRPPGYQHDSRGGVAVPVDAVEAVVFSTAAAAAAGGRARPGTSAPRNDAASPAQQGAALLARRLATGKGPAAATISPRPPPHPGAPASPAGGAGGGTRSHRHPFDADAQAHKVRRLLAAAWQSQCACVRSEASTT
jgi:hypothetical protein